MVRLPNLTLHIFPYKYIKVTQPIENFVGCLNYPPPSWKLFKIFLFFMYVIIKLCLVFCICVLNTDGYIIVCILNMCTYMRSVCILEKLIFIMRMCVGCFSIKVVKALMGIEWNVLTEKFKETSYMKKHICVKCH